MFFFPPVEATKSHKNLDKKNRAFHVQNSLIDHKSWTYTFILDMRVI